MTSIHDFVGTLVVTGKSLKEIQQIVKNIYSDKAIKQSQIYYIFTEENTGCRSVIPELLRERRITEFTADVGIDIENDGE
jgi:hypothetical protein